MRSRQEFSHKMSSAGGEAGEGEAGKEGEPGLGVDSVNILLYISGKTQKNLHLFSIPGLRE